MGTRVKYKDSTIALLSEGSEATLHTENTVLTGDIQVVVDKGSGISKDDTFPWSQLDGVPNYIQSEAKLAKFIQDHPPTIEIEEEDPTVADWAKKEPVGKPPFKYGPGDLVYKDGTTPIGSDYPWTTSEDVSDIIEEADLSGKFSQELNKALTNKTIQYDHLGGKFPGVEKEGDPKFEAWKTATFGGEKYDLEYAKIPGALILGETSDDAYRGDFGKQNSKDITDIQDELVLIQEKLTVTEIPTIKSNITNLQGDISTKVTSNEVQDIITAALYDDPNRTDDGMIMKEIKDKILEAELGGSEGPSEDAIASIANEAAQALIDSTFADWTKKDILSYNDLAGLPTIYTLGTGPEQAYPGNAGQQCRDDIDNIMAWRAQFYNDASSVISGKGLRLFTTAEIEEKEVEVTESQLTITTEGFLRGSNVKFVFPTKLTEGTYTLATLENLNNYTLLDDFNDSLEKFNEYLKKPTVELLEEEQYNKNYIYGYYIRTEIFVEGEGEERVETIVPRIEDFNFEVSKSNVGDSLVQRDMNGYISVYVNSPSENNHPATKQYVDNILNNYCLKNNVYSKEEVYSKAEIDSKIAEAGSVDLSNYLTKSHIEDNYYTKSSIDSNYYNRTYIDANFISSSSVSNNYYTKIEADGKFITSSNLTTSLVNYYTKTEADGRFIIAEGYPTKDTLSNSFTQLATAQAKITSLEGQMENKITASDVAATITGLKLSETYAAKSIEGTINGNTSNINTLKETVGTWENQDQDISTTIAAMQETIANLRERISILEGGTGEEETGGEG